MTVSFGTTTIQGGRCLIAVAFLLLIVIIALQQYSEAVSPLSELPAQLRNGESTSNHNVDESNQNAVVPAQQPLSPQHQSTTHQQKNIDHQNSNGNAYETDADQRKHHGSLANGFIIDHHDQQKTDSADEQNYPFLPFHQSNHVLQQTQHRQSASVDVLHSTAEVSGGLKTRPEDWVQLSGHQGTIVRGSNYRLLKKLPQENHAEAQAYEKISQDPALNGVTPKFFGKLSKGNEVSIEIQDLLAEAGVSMEIIENRNPTVIQFPDAANRAVMDIKIGTRTFLESEVANQKKRPDLYDKLLELAKPSELANQGITKETVTKKRYMEFRERMSSSATLGFRIEAAQLIGGGRFKKEDLKSVSSSQEVSKALRRFLGQQRELMAVLLGARLKQIHAAVEASKFFHTHEVVGSSVLLVHNQHKAGAWLIDFAKCIPHEGHKLTHRAKWQMGNHEEGYLTGLDNLINLLEAVGA